jgi:hypothetical protein
MYPRMIQPHHEGGIVAQEDIPLQGTAGRPDPCLVLTSDPKPRLRWTADLHERFIDAVTQLGGSSSQYFLSSFLLLILSCFCQFFFFFFVSSSKLIIVVITVISPNP